MNDASKVHMLYTDIFLCHSKVLKSFLSKLVYNIYVQRCETLCVLCMYVCMNNIWVWIVVDHLLCLVKCREISLKLLAVRWYVCCVL